MITLQVVLILGSIAIIGIVSMRYLDRYTKNSPSRTLIMMCGLAIILNIMIFTFCAISFSKIKFAAGQEGPSGLRGSRGKDGDPASIAVCGNTYISASELKFKSKNLELQKPKKPYILED